jgi:hypothetical protein
VTTLSDLVLRRLAQAVVVFGRSVATFFFVDRSCVSAWNGLYYCVPSESPFEREKQLVASPQ